VTVFDLSDEMLARDQAAASRYGLTIKTIRGDPPELSKSAALSYASVDRTQGRRPALISAMDSGMAVRISPVLLKL
jgi:hypothetical protein